MTTQQALSDMPTELQLLVACSRTELDAISVEKLGTLTEAGLDWSQVLSSARHHGVTPLLHRHLSRFSEGIPAFVLDELGRYVRDNAVHNLMLSHALLGVLAELSRVGIEAVPYKGPVLASSAYGDVSLRSFKDLDVIVQPRDFEQAAAGLEALGYKPTGNDPQGHFHQSFVHSETGVMLELHHDVLRRSVFPTPLTMTKLWPRLTEVSLLGKPVKSFSPEDTLLLLCLHGSSHAWQGLTWLGDVAEHVRAHEGLAWERFLETAKQARLLRMALLGIKLAHEVLDVPLPKGVLNTVNADRKLQTLSQTIVLRWYSEVLGQEAALTQRLQLQMRSGWERVPLYGRIVRKRLQPVLEGYRAKR